MPEQESDLKAQMRKNLETMKSMGFDPYETYSFERTHTSAGVRKEFADIGQDKSDKVVSVAGRVMAKRIHGKAGFADLVDRDGKVQLYFKLNDIGKDLWELFLVMDRGDVVGVGGNVFRTKMGEITVAVAEFKVLSKALTPLPEKFHGLQDVQMRYRQRYLDLMMNEDVRDRFIKRGRLVAFMRNWLNEKEFIEIETPILQPLYGGALARPFITHHNYLDIDLYLRIAPELYHKRCIVGNLERVYEFGKNFRNEDIDAQHYPEYTSLELYQAYVDYFAIMDLTESIMYDTAMHITGTEKIPYGDHVLNFAKPWPRITMTEAIRKHTGLDVSTLKTVDDARDAAVQLGVRDIEDCQDMGKVISVIFDQKIQPSLIDPVFIIDHPVGVSPLAKKKRGAPDLVERFELFINGWELANAFSELNDPVEQERRFREQDRLKQEGDEEAHPIDSDYVRALEYGLPPTGGLGIGIDRFAMILTNAPSIKEVILFPHMKPESV
ncbi:MAG: lysine--tRNA ligase [Candidatus Thermoplasmatota archaeon]|nr:lysine--tRNA ligase [Candidatus Thermoplasmatota archaeon]